MSYVRRKLWVLAAMAAWVALAAAPARAAGQIDPDTLVSAPHGTFGRVRYVRYEAMFEGVTPRNHPYRVPCQIIAPANPDDGSGLVLFDWLVSSTIVTALGQEQADARYTMTDEFLFSRGLAYTTVRADVAGIGKSSPIVDPTRPWSDNLLNTSSEFIQSAGDEFDIVVDYVRALRTDPEALEILGAVQRTAAFGYSASGSRLRGLLRLQAGEGLFDFSLVGGAGNGYSHPAGNKLGYSNSEKAPLPGAGLEIDFQTETDVVALGAHKARHADPNYRSYEFAGAAHLRDVDAAEFGLADPASANPAEWTPFIRALFVAADNWSLGIEPPPSLWLGAPNDASIARDANGNALVRYVGGLNVTTGSYRLPEVAVGQNRYIPLAPEFNDGTFLGTFRMLAGSHLDLTASFLDHDDYVDLVTGHAEALVKQGYLLPEDAAAIILRAKQSDIGK